MHFLNISEYSPLDAALLSAFYCEVLSASQIESFIGGPQAVSTRHVKATSMLLSSWPMQTNDSIGALEFRWH